MRHMARLRTWTEAPERALKSWGCGEHVHGGYCLHHREQGASMLRTWTEALHHGRGRWVRACIAPRL